jgi:uncharacterized protein YprB with RNaseH-like and TPR domain
MDRLNKQIHFDEALDLFTNEKIATKIARDLCETHGLEYNESEGRKVRAWLNPAADTQFDENYIPKILIYDIETTLLLAEVWNAGKMSFMHASSLHTETEIITVAYKWLGDDTVHTLEWDNKKKNDKQLVKDFVKIYNSADIVVGVNNDRFDNKIVNARAAKYRLFVNTQIKSIDVQKQAKSIWRLPSHSMKYMAKFFGLTHKLEHEGIDMWRDIQWGSKKVSRAALDEMITYNIGDIVTTEEIYFLVQMYAKHQVHMGVMTGQPRWSCPDTGSHRVKLYETTFTATGRIKRVMKSKETKRLYTISNMDYLRFLKEQHLQSV